MVKLVNKKNNIRYEKKEQTSLVEITPSITLQSITLEINPISSRRADETG